MVNMAIPEPGEHVHPLGRNHLRVLWDGERADLADGGDALVVDQDHAIHSGSLLKAVDQAATDPRRGRTGDDRQSEGERQCEQAEKLESVSCWRL